MFETVFTLSLYGAIAVAVVVLLRLIPKLTSNVKFVLWCLVFLRLILPLDLVTIPSVVSLQMVVPATSIAKALPVREAETTAETPAEGSRPETAVPPVPAASNTEAEIDWMGLLEDVWLAGMATCVLLMVFFYVRASSKNKHKTTINGVYMSDHVHAPVVMGIFRPKIVLPASVNPEAAGNILHHERTHIKRGDHITKPLFLLITAVHWFNPLVWLAYCLAVRDMEMAVDEAVLRASSADIRKTYATELLNAAQGGATVFPRFGESDVKRRIKSILNFKKPSRWIAAVSVLFLIATAVFLLGGGGKTDTPNALVPTVMVDDVLYSIADREVFVNAEDSEILGRITSTVPVSELPTENGQANIPFQDAPYARFKNGVVLLMDGKWTFFEPRDKPPELPSPTAEPTVVPAQTPQPNLELAKLQEERHQAHLTNFAEYPRGEDGFATEYEGDWDGDGKLDHAYFRGDSGERVIVALGNGESISADAEELELMSYWGRSFLLTAADLTGDGQNEIVLLIDLGGQGGRGSYGLYPYRRNGDGWELMDTPRYGLVLALTWENSVATVSNGDYSEVVADADMIRAHYAADHAEDAWEAIKNQTYFKENAADAICDIAFVEENDRTVVMISQYTVGMTDSHVDGLGYFVTTLGWDDRGNSSIIDRYFVLWPQGQKGGPAPTPTP